MCGNRIGQPGDGANGTSTIPASGAPGIPSNRNTLSYHEDRNGLRFDASLTDSAMHGLGDVFGELFARRGVGRNVQVIPRSGTGRDIVIEEPKQLQAPTTATEPTPEPQQQSAPLETIKEPAGHPDKVRLLKIFILEGEVLELSDDRMKAKSAADYYKRLTYLFLYAQEVLLGRNSTPRNELSAVLTAAKVNNGNCRFWLTKKDGFTVNDEDRMKLVVKSREQATKALGEILDPDFKIEKEWHPDTRTVKTRGPRKKK